MTKDTIYHIIPSLSGIGITLQFNSIVAGIITGIGVYVFTHILSFIAHRYVIRKLTDSVCKDCPVVKELNDKKDPK